MKLTEQCVSEFEIDYIILFYSKPTPDGTWIGSRILKAFLELKQRRAEDRQREYDGK